MGLGGSKMLDNRRRRRWVLETDSESSADAGSHVFSLTLSATGTQTIGVQDVANGSLKGQTSLKVVANGGGTGGGGSGGGGKNP